jgi:D-amino-acid dehydrogenase
MTDKQDILIIGGGVIGAAIACDLAQRGAKVTLIDKGQIGHGCSYGNAGWVTPCFALPLPMPGMLIKSLRWMLDPEGPLYIKPRPSWELLRWLTCFALSMNHRKMDESTKALTELATYSLQAFGQIDAQEPGCIGFTKSGLVMAAATPAGAQDARAAMEMIAKHGIRGQAMSADELRRFEPALTGELAGGVYFPDEAHVEPLAAVQTLARLAARAGATILPETELFEFVTNGRRIDAVRTTRGLLRADQFVLATGSWSTSIARSLRLRVPIIAGKGYAVIVEPFTPAPTRPIILLENKIGVTPRQNSVRLAGTMELVGLDESITPRRVAAMFSGSRRFLNLPAEPRVIEVWRGLRPCTPDGMPIIGRPARFENLMLAAGHQMLGLLTAPGTAKLVGDLITGSSPQFDPHPFRATRF